MYEFNYALKEILAVTASICGIIQFLSGGLVCIKFVKNKSTGDASGLAFVTCFMSCSLWMLYGFLINDTTITVVNVFGSLLQFFYILIYYIYTINKKLIVQQMSLAFAFVGIMYFYGFVVNSSNEGRERIGALSCALTILFFASPLTMLAHVIKIKSTDSLPFPIIVTSFVTSCQWFVYGCLIEDRFIQIPNFLGCILSGFQLALFAVYPRKNYRKGNEELLI